MLDVLVQIEEMYSPALQLVEQALHKLFELELPEPVLKKSFRQVPQITPLLLVRLRPEQAEHPMFAVLVHGEEM